MVSHYYSNFILRVILALCFIKDITCQTRFPSTTSSLSSTTSSYKYYSKSTGMWKTVKYMIEGSEMEGSSRFSKHKKLSTPEECARPCRNGVAPKTCHFKWTFELYHTYGGACQLCTPTTNTSISSDCQCILADGADVSGIIVANRQIPGPAIQVCIGDMVIVDVTNKVTGNSLSIHWHGLYQKDFQHYDGVPFLTQCPIPFNTEFRYQWRAQNPGTHFWHAHSGVHKLDGVDGLIVIRTPIEDVPSRELYDHDGFDHHMFIQDWIHDNSLDHFPGTTFNHLGQNPDNFLINGRGQWLNPATGRYTTTPFTVFNVQQGERYRFRVVDSSALVCPIELQVENHDLTIIAIDGCDVQPRQVTTITLFSAERVDFILNANQSDGSYWIQIRGLSDSCERRRVQQHAILRYEGSKCRKPRNERPSYNRGLPRGVVFNPYNEVCNGTTPDVVCVKDMESAEQPSERILNSEPDVQIYLPFYFHTYDKNDLFRPNTYQKFVDPTTNLSLAAIVDGVSNVPPSSPPISQFEDIPDDDLCPDPNNLPERCDGFAICHCTHIIDIPLNAMVEVIVADIGPVGLSHPYHLHGYGYHVMGSGLLSAVNITNYNRASALERDRYVYPPRSPRPPVKDTLAVPSAGYTIVRFVADNPGWWLFHCHFIAHLYNGMSVIFHVGNDYDLPPTPPNFPTCGNFKPEILSSNPKLRSEART